ncbi:MAG: CHASE2 domain-containing protein, partial [bacterium]
MLYNELYFPLRGKIKPNPAIVIVGIDDPFIRRGILSSAIKTIANEGAIVIGVDAILSKPSEYPEDDIALEEALKKAGNVILASCLDDRKNIVYPIESLRRSAKGNGFANMVIEDGIVYREFISLQKCPSFVTLIICNYLSMGEEDLYKAVRNNGTILINFVGGARSFPIIPLNNVLKKGFERGFFKDKIVLMGATSLEGKDMFSTPFGRISGVEIHANAIQSIIEGVIGRGYIHKAGNRTSLFFIATFVSLCSMFLLTPIGVMLTILVMLFSLAFSSFLFIYLRER